MHLTQPCTVSMSGIPSAVGRGHPCPLHIGSSSRLIIHSVDFTLIHPNHSAEEADFLGSGRSTLSLIPGVENFRVLRQVSSTSNFHYMFSMEFGIYRAI